MKYISVLLIIASTLSCTATKAQVTQVCDTVYKDVDINAQYKNGSKDLSDFAWKDLMPVLSKGIYRIEDAPTRLLIYLTIDMNGNVIEANFKRSTLTKSCETQLIERLIKMKGWIPGKANGKPVCSIFYFPISCIKWDE